MKNTVFCAALLCFFTGLFLILYGKPSDGGFGAFLVGLGLGRLMSSGGKDSVKAVAP